MYIIRVDATLYWLPTCSQILIKFILLVETSVWRHASQAGVPFLYVGSCMVGMAYGSHWSIQPPILAEVFGLQHFASLYKINSWVKSQLSSVPFCFLHVTLKYRGNIQVYSVSRMWTMQLRCPNWCVFAVCQDSWCFVRQSGCSLQKPSTDSHCREHMLGHPVLWAISACSRLLVLSECHHYLLVYDSYSPFLYPAAAIFSWQTTLCPGGLNANNQKTPKSVAGFW